MDMDPTQVPPSTPPPPPVSSGSFSGPDKSSTGMEPNVAAGLACIVWIAGLIFFLIEKESKFVKFYAFQNLIFGLTSVLIAIPFLGWLYGVVYLVVWIVQMVNAFGGKVWKIPIIGNIAAQQAGM